MYSTVGLIALKFKFGANYAIRVDAAIRDSSGWEAISTCWFLHSVSKEAIGRGYFCVRFQRKQLDKVSTRRNMFSSCCSFFLRVVHVLLMFSRAVPVSFVMFFFLFSLLRNCFYWVLVFLCEPKCVCFLREYVAILQLNLLAKDCCWLKHFMPIPSQCNLIHIKI